MPHRRDHYEVLEVGRDATARQIRDAYRRLARRFHPDAGPEEPDAERRFKAIGRAWETLRDPARRRAYDRRRERARFAGPGEGRRQSYPVEEGPLYHEDLGHHSDFYQAGDPLSVADAAALTGRRPEAIRRAIRSRRLAASREGRAYLLRRREVERWHRAPRDRVG